jgi:pyridoxal/pyridoxine/pyridoxamine kinase
MALFKMKGFPKQTVTGKQIQQLDDMIQRAKKLGKEGTAQVLIDKKSKLEDKMQKEYEKEKYYSSNKMANIDEED